MTWIQREITLAERNRGFHLITSEVLDQLPEIADVSVGLINLFLKHTSASLAINEGVEPEVRGDIERHFNEMVPENASYYQHNYEGPDDMPAHIKAVMLGSSLTIPIRNGRLNLGSWQGIYLCEHRNRGGSRRLAVTIMGEVG
jgi:secondary thiamine-phosphate synthase enzyme